MKNLSHDNDDNGIGLVLAVIYGFAIEAAFVVAAILAYLAYQSQTVVRF